MFSSSGDNKSLFGAGASGGNSLFGGQTQGGLFGASTNQTSLFSNPPQGGNPLQQQPSNQPQSIFGGQNQGGLLSSNMQPANPILPSNQPQSNFGGQNQGGLFGPSGNSAMQGGNLNLAQNSNQTQPLIGGQNKPLFSNSAAQGAQTQPPLFNQASGPQNLAANNSLNQNKDNKQELTFGEDIHQKGSPNKAGQNVMRELISSHLTVDDLFKKWKKDLEEQVNDFMGLGRDLNKNEKDLYEVQNMLFNLNSNLKQLETDYQSVQGSLSGLETQQDDLMAKLSTLEIELSKSLPENEDNYSKSRSLISKAKDLNKETLQIEDSLEKIIDEINQPFKDNNEDISKILNSYYDALEFIELDTLAIQTKLNQFESFVEKKGFK